MRLEIESLKIRNFKGIKEQDIVFDPVETSICGENGTGKTTVVDAFNWLLFEKDSQGRTQFEIKTLKDGQVINGLDHSVEANFNIDGRPLKLKKIYREVWSKKNGDNQERFTGHERERFVNDVPVTKGDYDKKIYELVDEKIFQLLTDPRYFSMSLHWTDRRKTLFELAGGEVTKEDVLKAEPRLQELKLDLEDKSIDELKETLRYQRGQTNKERENIPVKINTLHETIREVDKTSLDIKIRSTKGSIKAIEDQMLDASKLNEEMLKKQDEVFKLKSKAKEIEYEVRLGIKDPDEPIKAEISKERNDMEIKMSEADLKRREVGNLEKVIQRKDKTLSKLREDYQFELEKKLEIGADISECPTCRRPFQEHEISEKVAELEGNFKESQVKILTGLRNEGQSLGKEVEEDKVKLEIEKSKLEKIEFQIAEHLKDIKVKEALLGKTKAPTPEELLKENEEYQETILGIEVLEGNIKSGNADTQITELKKKKANLENELRELEKDLHQDEINEKTNEKIKALMEEEKILSQKINTIERKEKLVEDYISTHARLIEKMINDKFENVSFRLFKKQTNGGLDETCDVLVDGVPFDNANTAGQVNAGLDVINSLCQHYNTYTPIFIDNRESVNELIPTNSQLVNLKVTKHKTLRVEK